MSPLPLIRQAQPARRPPVERSSCERCPHRALCGQNDVTGTRIRVPRNASLYRDGDPVDGAVYSIRCGSFKLLGAGPAAQAPVIAFALPPDFLALGALGIERHMGGAVALEDSEVCRLPWSRLARQGWNRRQPAGAWQALLTAALRNEQRAALMLRHTDAELRLADLLLSLSRRHAANGYAALQFRLSMARRDIASFVGVSAECISRLIAQFHRRGWIAIAGREVTLHEPAALYALLANRAPALPRQLHYHVPR